MAGTAMLLALTAHHAAAQTAPAGEAATATDETEEQAAARRQAASAHLSPITVTGGPGVDPYSTPGAMSSVSTDQVDTFGQRNIGDVLRSLPGTFSRDSIQNAGLSVNIRGFEGSGRVNMMIDGVRQNFRFTGHEAQGFLYVDPQLVAGVDVMRGAVSTAGGAGALAGSANVRTYDIDDILKDGKNWGALTTLTWGSNEIGFSEMASGAIRSEGGGAGVIAAISRHDQGNYENGAGVTVPFTEQELTSGLVKAEFNPTDELFLKFGAVLYDNDFFANSYFQNLQSNTFTSELKWDPDSDWIDLTLRAYHNDLTMDYDTNTTGGGSAAGRVIEDKGSGFDIANVSRFDLGPVSVRSEYGFEYFYDDVDTYNETTPSSGGGVNPSGESGTGGAFSQTTFTYGLVDLIAGLRYDFYTLDGTYYVGGVTATELDRSDGRINPKLTLAFNPTEWLQPYVTYSESFRPPTISETMLGGSHPGGGVGFSPNPLLEPEVQKGWEIGANVKTDGILTEADSLRIKANYYYMDVDNYVTAVFGPAVYFDNVEGTSVVQGFELETAYDAGFAFGSLNYGYTHSDLPTQAAGLGAPQILPEHVLTFTAGARFFERRLTVGGRVSYVSETYSGQDEVSSNPPNWPEYTLVDLFTNYEFNNGLELSANITNLFDEEYTPALSNITSFSGDTGRGRTFLLTAKAHF